MRPRVEGAGLDDDNDLVPPKGSASAVTVDDTDALDCCVCYHPLKPSIFQCIAGHVVCSPCRNKLIKAPGGGKCPVCRVDVHGYSLRNHAMERLVESVRAPCPNAAHGCAARPAYYEWRRHRETCPYAPYSCPREGCDFVGAAASLLDHISRVHFNVKAMQQFWANEVTALMAKLDMAADVAGFEREDIDLIVVQTGLKRGEAIKALKEKNGDLFDAILRKFGE